MPDHLYPPESDLPPPRDELMPRLKAGDEALHHVMRLMVTRFSTGELVVAAGQPQKQIYRLVSGLIARERLFEDGRRQLISIFTPGDLLVVKAMLLMQQPDNIRCLTGCTLHALDYKAGLALASANADVGFRFMWQLAEDDRRLCNNVAMLGQGNALERIAAMLIDITSRWKMLGWQGSDPVRAVDLRQQDIADYLGLTPVHINRTLRTMREEGAIRVEARKITISDRTAVSRYAAPMLDAFEREAPEFNGRAVS